MQPKTGEPLPNSPLAVDCFPRQQGRLIIRADGIRLLIENLRQRRRATPSRADTKNNGLCHRTYCISEAAPEKGIAKGSGVSQSIVNRFVTGERSIGIDTAAKLCAYLRLTLKR